MQETDYEQGEAVKQWFIRWGNYLIGAIVVVALCYGGWWFYTEQQQSARVDASDQYQSLVRLVEGNASLTEAQRQELTAGVERLSEEHADTSYALFAGMLEARVAADNGNFDAAVETLRTALAAAGKGHSLEAILNYRLARALYGAGQPEAALAQLDQIQPGGQAVAYHELRGDIQLDQGNRAAARAAYESAWQEAEERGVQNAFLRLKAQNAGAL